MVAFNLTSSFGMGEGLEKEISNGFIVRSGYSSAHTEIEPNLINLCHSNSRLQ